MVVVWFMFYHIDIIIIVYGIGTGGTSAVGVSGALPTGMSFRFMLLTVRVPGY